MDVLISAGLGMTFLIVGVAAVFLMYHLWGYPFDKVGKRSAAPPGLMRLHRVLGWVYVIIYIVMMVEMVPRLWSYQVEFPARTVIHLCLGMTIGIILLVKISILRWFRHLEEMMPVLGTMLLICTILLSGLSLPFAFREFALASTSDGGGVYSQENLERVARQLPRAGFPEKAPLEELATARALRAGRTVLVRKCVVCHDLKTILMRPRTPSNWVKTVERMAQKPSFTEPLTEPERWTSAVYLIAISPELQRSVKEKREQELAREKTEEAMLATVAETTAAPAAKEFDEPAAKKAYEVTCSECHELSDVDAAPPTTPKEVDALIQRMILENEMKADKDTLAMVQWYMIKKFAGAAKAGA
ncbi:MAG: hypothetical protein H6713_11300 [Myxococcales bacterium]|nr:hypothetical protein [Myxococcales bacterium]MCB9750560.1 hypothetical protein [Myxococcales bacterium]